jgi:hypothetical protein
MGIGGSILGLTKVRSFVKQVDGTGSGSSLKSGFNNSGVETSDSAARVG